MMDQNQIKSLYGLSPLQQGMLFHFIEDKHATSHVQQAVFHLSGEVHHADLQTSLDLLLQKHDVLRTVFLYENLQQPVQVVLKERKAVLHFADLSQMTADEQSAYLTQYKQQDRHCLFDLSRDLLVRFSLFQLDEQSFQLVWTYHHIILDGWCIGLLLDDLLKFYEQTRQHQPIQLQASPAYRTYINWLKTKDPAQIQAYWDRFLQGYEPVATLPTANTSSATTTTPKAEAERLYTISADVTKQLQQFAQQHQVTLNTVFQTLWGIVLQKYNYTQDVVFGTVVSGRSAEIAQVEQMVGLLINTVPMRVQTQPNEQLASLLTRVQQSMLAIEENHAISLAEIQAIHRSRSGLIDHLLVFENFPFDREAAQKQTTFLCTDVEIFGDTSYNLVLLIVPDDEMKLKFVFNPDVYEPKLIDSLFASLQSVIEQAIAKPVVAVSAVSIVNEEEQARLLHEFHSSPTNESTSETIVSLFERKVQQIPEQIAASYQSTQLSYDELNRKANQLARRLQAEGVKPGERVGMLVDRSLDLLVGVLAIVKAGGAYVPMEPSYPTQRIHYVLQDSGANILLTQEDYLNTIPSDYTGDVICLDQPDLYTGNADNLPIVAKPEDLIYLIYTSGSTGQPKGVMVEHRHVVQHLYHGMPITIAEGEVWAMFHSYCFDVSVWELFGSLLHGAKLVVLPEDVVKSPQQLRAVLAAERVNSICQTPSAFAPLSAAEMQQPTQDLHLKRIVLAGEALAPAQLAAWKERYPATELWNCYGPTETTVYATYKLVTEMEIKENISNIGRPLPTLRAYVLDADGQLVPMGAKGELYISGAGVTRGYLNQTELTAERFLPDPFNPGERMYRTGDFVRWLETGELESLGRIDDQVKIRGYRIELGEIQACLQAYTGVQEAVVIAKQETVATALCAYVVGDAVDVAQLRAHLAQSLPSYMIPSYFVQLAALPLTVNGKLDKNALPEPSEELSRTSEYVPPSSDTEIKLVELWQSVLQVAQVGVTDDFFELGGHSLKAVALISRINQAFEVELPLKALFDHPTIAGLAQYIKEATHQTQMQITPAPLGANYPVTSMQKRLYVLEEMQTIGAGYHMPIALELSGDVDLKRLQSSLDQLMQRHEALRTAFSVIEGELRQHIVTEVNNPIEPIELEATSETVLKTAIDQAITDWISQPFDLSHAPLIRAGLLTTANHRYILVLNLHHIIADGLSIQQLLREFIACYQGEALPELRIQYKDYAVWQQQSLAAEQLEREQAYWMEQMTGDLPVLAMPTDFTRPAIQQFAGDQHLFTLPPELYGKLKQLATTKGCTLYMTLLAAYYTMLTKYTGQADFVVGMPVAGRPHLDLESVVGMFVNTLPIRCKPQATKSFVELLSEVKEQVLQAQSHSMYPLEELIEKLDLQRDLSRNPLFDTVFALQNISSADWQLAELTTTPVGLSTKTSKFDLTWTAVEDDGITFAIEYSTALFQQATIERMAGHFVHVLKQLTEHPTQRLDAFELVTPAEQSQLLSEFNSQVLEPAEAALIHERIIEQAQRTPDAIAVVSEHGQLTYQALCQQANQLARHLRANGIGREQIVGILVDNRPDMLVAILGVLQAGAAYLPIDPTYPAERIRYMLQDSQAACLLLQPSLPKPTKFTGKLISLEKASYTHESSETVPSINNPTDLAYVIYTSGSTGKPKGVMVEHRALWNLATWHNRFYAVTSADCATKFASFGFDASVWEIFPYLLAGATLYIVPEAIRHDLTALQQYYLQHEITISFLPTQLAEQFMQMPHPTLRALLVGGDQLRQVPETTYAVYNNYGPTENAVVTTSTQVTAGQDLLPIGRPIDRNEVYVLNSQQQLQPIGIPGELCVSGASLARGYLHNAALTQAAFVPNPIRAGEVMYRTGDLVRWLPDGQLDYLGRLDNQVKMRGYRIELGEIEYQLLQQAGISEAVVIASPATADSTTLCAYLVGTAYPDAQLRAMLEQTLPAYMVPTHFVYVDQLPMTPNGKVDTKALPLPEPSKGLQAYQPPRTRTEETLVSIWQDVLQMKSIGIQDNFFQLGGHSIKAMMLVSRIQQQLAVKVPMRIIFAQPTIERLAEFIEAQAGVDQVLIEPAPDAANYPITSAQKRLYVVQGLAGAGTSYQIPILLELQGKLDVSKLQAAFTKLIDRHEILRTSFQLVGEEVRQCIHQQGKFDFAVVKAPHDDALDELIATLRQPFDLSQAPLFRVRLIQRTADRSVLLIDMHHLISDGVSTHLLLQEWSQLYQQKQLPPVRIQYRDYVVWQHKHAQSEQWDQQQQYWLDQFADSLPVLQLPTDRPRPPVQTFTGDSFTFQLSSQELASLKQLAQTEQTTLYNVLLACYNVLLMKYSKQEDFIIGFPTAGRTHADVEQVLGMFINTLPIRNRPTPEQSFAYFLSQVKQQVWDALDHADYPLEALLDQLGLKRDVSRNPLFDTVFVLQNMELSMPDVAGVQCQPYELATNTAKFDLTWTAVEADGLTIAIEYSTALFERSTIERMAAHFQHLLRQVTEQPARKLAEIELVTPTEKKQLLDEFGSGAQPHSVGQAVPIYQQFLAQAAATPHKQVVVSQYGSMTYQELREQANQLAAHLRRRGVGREDIVGILIDNRPEMLVGILGVLQAGAAYLPIDPTYPTERINYLLTDSQATCLLTHSQLAVPTGYAGEVILLDSGVYLDEQMTDLESINDVTDLAYVIYTSGSTGKPKGVMVQHQALDNLVRWHNRYYDVTLDDRATKFASFGFDASVWEIFPYLLAGATLYMIPEQIRHDLLAIGDYYQEHQITISFLPTQLAEQFMGWPHPSLRALLVGGDQLRQVPETTYRVYNNYGPTENAVVTTSTEITAGQDVLPIGRPIDHNFVYVLDQHQQLQPIGVPGELCISGASLAKGYLHRPDLTAAAFVPNPYRPGEFMYRTGDLVCWQADGQLVYLGRIDQQVKVRGYRIELGEIEHQLLQQAGVTEAVVIARNEDDSQTTLCAYIVGAEQSAAHWRQLLGQTLPAYMIPAYFIHLDALPMTPNGKVDTKSLPSLQMQTEKHAYVAPSSALEEKFMQIWADVLNVPQVGMTDNFFELGGDSIRGIQIIARLRQEGYQLEMKDLFQFPTIGELAPILKPLENVAEQGIVTGDTPLSPIQRWFFAQDFTNAHHWNQSMMLYSADGFEEQKVTQAFQQLVEHHDALRMHFALDPFAEQHIAQRIKGLTQTFFQITAFDLRNVDDVAQRIETEANALQRKNRLFGGPLIQLGLFHTADGDHLLFVLHHLLTDGVSWRILTEDFTLAYGQAIRGEPIKLPLKTHSYQSWTTALQQYANDKTVLREIPYWREMEQISVQELPKLQTTEEACRFQGMQQFSFELSAEQTQVLLGQAHAAYGTQVNELLLAAIAFGIKDWSGQANIPILMEGHGREAITEKLDISRTIGWFTSMYPVVLQLTDGDVSQGIKSIKETIRQIPNKGFGYGVLKYMTSPTRKSDLHFQISPEISFNYLGQFGQSGVSLSPMSMGEQISPSSEVVTPLEFTGLVAEEQFRLFFRFHTKRFERTDMEYVFTQIQHHLQQILAHCMNKEEREQTPSDFTAQDELTIEELDDLFEVLEEK